MKENEKHVYTEAEINANVGWSDSMKDIAPSVFYQIYGLDNIWFWDNEGKAYTFNPDLVQWHEVTYSSQTITGDKDDLALSSANIGNYYATFTWGTATTTAPTTVSGDKANSVLVFANKDKWYKETIINSYKWSDGTTTAPEGVEESEIGTYVSGDDLLIADNYLKWFKSVSGDTTTYYQVIADSTTLKYYQVVVSKLYEIQAVTVYSIMKFVNYYQVLEVTGDTTTYVWSEAYPVLPSDATVESEAKSDTLLVSGNKNKWYKEEVTVSPYEYNKYGELVPEQTVNISLTLSSHLLAKYPCPIIIIDGKEYDKNHTSAVLTMGTNHRIVIDWSHNYITETFRLIAKR